MSLIRCALRLAAYPVEVLTRLVEPGKHALWEPDVLAEDALVVSAREVLDEVWLFVSQLCNLLRVVALRELLDSGRDIACMVTGRGQSGAGS